MYAIRKPCWINCTKFLIPKSYLVTGIYDNENEIRLDGMGVWVLDRFIVVKTLKQANKIIKLIKENTNEQDQI